MLFAHDTAEGMQAAVALVNSAIDPDTLVDLHQLALFYAEYGYTGRFDADQAELQAVRQLRPRLRQLFTATRDDAVVTTNKILREEGALPQLVRHGDVDWHLHAVESDRPLATRIAVETAMAMADVIRMDEMSRLSVCADAGCDGLVFDMSRNRSRRFCSKACSNRAAVNAYRARRAV
jgi:predicted RNA-binding Zn ribbon-like protein